MFFDYVLVLCGCVIGGLKSGMCNNKTSTIEVTAELEKEVMKPDDEETFANFYRSVSPSKLLESSVVLTEEDLSQLEADTPKLVHKNPTFSFFYAKQKEREWGL